MRRDVRRIGLHDEGRFGHRRGDTADLQRAVEGQRAAETQLEAQVNKGLGLLLAAIERMRNAAMREVHAAQAGQQLVGAAAHMQQHREAGALGELELLDIEMLLDVGVQAFDEKIQADLAHRHQPRVGAVGFQRFGELAEIAFSRAHHAQWMNAQRIGEIMLDRQQPHGVEVGCIDCRDDDLRDTRRTGTRDDGTTVGVELGRVEMAVRIYPHCPLLQRNTTVRLPFSSTRCSACHWMARASATHSMSRPMPTSWSAV